MSVDKDTSEAKGRSRKGRPENAAPGKLLSPAARRALEEAEARRKADKAKSNADLPSETNGPSGEEPTRYGDWERGGIAYDF
jgi:hypothetical protein